MGVRRKYKKEDTKFLSQTPLGQHGMYAVEAGLGMVTCPKCKYRIKLEHKRRKPTTGRTRKRQCKRQRQSPNKCARKRKLRPRVKKVKKACNRRQRVPVVRKLPKLPHCLRQRNPCLTKKALTPRIYPIWPKCIAKATRPRHIYKPNRRPYPKSPYFTINNRRRSVCSISSTDQSNDSSST